MASTALAPHHSRESFGIKRMATPDSGPLACLMPRRDPELRAADKRLVKQHERLDAMADALEAEGDLINDLKHDIVDMTDQLELLRTRAGRQKAHDNVAKATSAVINLVDTFDKLDINSSGAIDVSELRRGLHHLGMDSHSAQANAIIERYTDHQTIDIKTFTTLVRDVHTLLTFDRDGSGTLDTEELKPALAQLGLVCSDEHICKIALAWDADGSGKLDLLE
jgi:hypothetical protein